MESAETKKPDKDRTPFGLLLRQIERDWRGIDSDMLLNAVKMLAFRRAGELHKCGCHRNTRDGEIEVRDRLWHLRCLPTSLGRHVYLLTREFALYQFGKSRRNSIDLLGLECPHEGRSRKRVVVIELKFNPKTNSPLYALAEVARYGVLLAKSGTLVAESFRHREREAFPLGNPGQLIIPKTIDSSTVICVVLAPQEWYANNKDQRVRCEEWQTLLRKETGIEFEFWTFCEEGLKDKSHPSRFVPLRRAW